MKLDLLQEPPTLPDHSLLVDTIEELDTSKSSEISTKLSSYLADDATSSKGGSRHREPFYCKELGFAMEKIKDGYTLADLWEVVPAVTAQTTK